MEKPQPIIRLLTVYEEYPFEAISINAMARLDQAKLKLAPAAIARFPSFLKILECFLQITNQHISEETLSDPCLVSIYRTFVGAIASNRLIDRQSAWRATKILTLNTVLHSALPDGELKSTFPFVEYSAVKLTPSILDCIEEFSDLSLDEEKTWLWRGWITESRAGGSIGLPLHPVYKKLGRPFTDALFDACDTYYRGTRYSGRVGLKELCQFIAQYQEEITSDLLRNPRFTASFWQEFFEFYMVSRYADGEGPPVSSLVSEWRKRVSNLVRSVLEPSGLFAKSLGPFPSPPPKYVPGSRTNIKTTPQGDEVKVKLITSIPLYVTDDEAMNLLMRKIQEEFDIFVKWAEWAVADIWERYQRRIRMAPKGIVRELYRVGEQYGNRKQITSRENPEHLQNAAATFERYKYAIPNIQTNIYYPRPTSQIAFELGLPVTDALYAHCVILVAEHPQITPSFLENCELFDRNEKRVGFVPGDSGPQLVSTKYRRGQTLAQQIVPLSKKTEAVVEQIIALTQYARDFLQAEGNDDWRYLLLTCKRGFGYPARVQDLYVTTSNEGRINAFAKSLGNSCALSFEERIALVRRFSLVALRASAGVLVYLRTNSVEEMSKALGHATYSPRLLSSYLPEPIAAFFRERWIRIFQTGIVVTALEGSKYLLPASGFESMAELNLFLCNHALNVPLEWREPDQHIGTQRAETKADKRVAIGVSTEILTALISLQTAVERSKKKVNATAEYWSEITKRLVTFIESELNARPDLRSYLSQARILANPILMEGLIHD